MPIAKDFNPPKRNTPTLFKRGDKIHFKGADSFFQGYFVSYIHKFPLTWNSDEAVRCVVQQENTGILLIKGCPKETNKGFPNEELAHEYQGCKRGN